VEEGFEDGMNLLPVRNVNEALYQGTQLLKKQGHLQTSRTGDTIEAPGPVTTIYERPWERVLFSPARDANPFFHFFEALWMLAGRRDLAFPARLLPRMKEFSDDGMLLQGSYGWRWRRQFGRDQIAQTIDLLSQNFDSRRAVIAMWNSDGEDVSSKDIPCNTHIYFKARQGFLSMTVCNRSNDMIWGAYGANAVHMSMLHEYVAAKLGLKMGKYYQISDSFHVYTSGPGGEVWRRVAEETNYDLYRVGQVAAAPMECEKAEWDEDLKNFFETFDAGEVPEDREYKTDWWRTTPVPLWKGFVARDMTQISRCKSPDWRRACQAWLRRRSK
jgi:hypothetical protein